MVASAGRQRTCYIHVMQQAFSADDIAAIRTALLAFFDENARSLPWRSTRDPYAIWVSEVMAQQTRVETVVPYYHRWLERFPDVDALADAPLDDVLKAWEGLGYYSRARNLHAAARIVRERHRAELPGSYEELRALPGVGEYTAGAVASIAFGERHPAVDGNVRRVIARLLDVAEPSRELLRAAADSLVPAERPGDFNQSLMELGATICTPRSPRCVRCPVRSLCRARAAGTQEQRPLPKRARPVPIINVATAVIRSPDDRLLIVRRGESGLLAGMWCFPGVEIGSTDGRPATVTSNLATAGAARAADHASTLARSLVDTAAPAVPLGIVEHAFSHRRERYHCFLIDATAVTRGADIGWVGERSGHALPRAQQRIRALALSAIQAAPRAESVGSGAVGVPQAQNRAGAEPKPKGLVAEQEGM